MMEKSYDESINQIKKDQVIKYIHETTFSILSALNKGEAPEIRIKMHPNPDKKTRSLPQHRKIDLATSKMARKLGIYIKLLSIIQNLLENNKYVTKRNIFYQYKHLFNSQSALDIFIQNLARTINIPRSSLNIITTAKGLIAGDLDILMNDGSLISANNNKFGVLIPNLIENIQALRTNAQFTLIVEKDATFQSLIDDNFTSRYSVIIITGKGEPDTSTRQLLNLLYRKFSMKFYCLTDANPYGLCIMSVYKYGSKTFTVHENEKLCVPTLEWIGLKLDDLEVFQIKNQHQFVMPLNKRDIAIAKGLIERLELANEYDLIKQVNKIIIKF